MDFKDNCNLIIYVELECLNCNNKDIKSYPPPGITLGEFNVHELSKLICKCGNTYQKNNPIYCVSPDWKGFENGNGQSKSKSTTKSKKEGNEDKDIDIKAIAKILVAKYHFKATKDTEDIYYYDSNLGVYIKNGLCLIKQQCLKSYPEILKKYVDEIIYHIIGTNYIDREDFDKDIEWIAAKDCMVNLKTGGTKPHSHECMAMTQIPYKCYAKTPCLVPYKILKFLHEVMTYENVETVLDFMAYSLWRAFPFHYWLLLNGSGRNGKGTTINLIKKLLGVRNVSGETLHRIVGNNFATANLYQKLANINADLSSKGLLDTGALKKLTGGDLIVGEHKHKSPFYFVNYAKLIFSANKISMTPDETLAFFARLLIINFPKRYLGDKVDPNLLF